jgi:hypothetical protein
MSCKMHELGTWVRVNSALRVSHKGKRLFVLKGDVGKVQAIDAKTHRLEVIIPRLEAKIYLNAQKVTPGAVAHPARQLKKSSSAQKKGKGVL